MMKRLLLCALLCVLAFSASAQTTTTYPATGGYISSSMMFLLDFDGGSVVSGTAKVYCYIGQSCAYANSPLALHEVAGTVMSSSNLAGALTWLGNNQYQLAGTASGVDSTNAPVTVSITLNFTIRCYRGCSKTFTGGSVSITQ
jgi:hypothetical protein